MAGGDVIIDLTEVDGSEEENAIENNVSSVRPLITKFVFKKGTVSSSFPRTIALTFPVKWEVIDLFLISQESKDKYRYLLDHSKRIYVGESTNPFLGRALFAAEKIFKGDFICLYRGKRMSKEECDARCRGRDGGEYFLDVTCGVIIDGSGVNYGAAMANHSCMPNASLEHDLLPGIEKAPYGFLRAVEDIDVGMEIEANYRYYNPATDGVPDFGDRRSYIPCRCLRPNCCGVLRLTKKD